ncbi:MAG: tetratricopeptide repeat protein, partial [Rubrivivax sp.]|nr:tetratricopeptide repeat protein [Pyrinomonadaceae bacterium]
MQRWIRSTTEGLCVALVLLAASGALAQSAETKAKALFKRGQTAYNAGDFEKAIGLYQEAYQLKPLPGFLFNIAQGYRQAGNFERAQFFFSRFVDTAQPRDPNLDTARALLAEVNEKERARLSQQKAQDENARLEAE